MCVCRCLYVCPCTHAEASGGDQVFSATSYLIPFRDLSLNLELGWQPASTINPPASTPHSAGLQERV